MKLVGSMAVIVMALAVGGCGKSLAQVKTMGNSAIDTGATIAKNGVGVGLSVYELLKSFWDDSKDNINVIKSAF